MSEPFLGEIRMFGGNFAPRGWALCDGSVLLISQYEALFSLLGTIYGGDGRSTFALPDLRGRLPVHPGVGPGLSERRVGQVGGSENVPLNANHLPSHRHAMMQSTNRPDSRNPRRRLPGAPVEPLYTGTTGMPQEMDDSSIQSSGGGQAHPNLMPFLCVNFIIALAGIYPTRN